MEKEQIVNTFHTYKHINNEISWKMIKLNDSYIV